MKSFNRQNTQDVKRAKKQSKQLRNLKKMKLQNDVIEDNAQQEDLLNLVTIGLPVKEVTYENITI